MREWARKACREDREEEEEEEGRKQGKGAALLQRRLW